MEELPIVESLTEKLDKKLQHMERIVSMLDARFNQFNEFCISYESTVKQRSNSLTEGMHRQFELASKDFYESLYKIREDAKNLSDTLASVKDTLKGKKIKKPEPSIFYTPPKIKKRRK